jgi:hypothetical protein
MSHQLAKSPSPVTGTEDLCSFIIKSDLLALFSRRIPQAIIYEKYLRTGIFQLPAGLEDRNHCNLRHVLIIPLFFLR